MVQTNRVMKAGAQASFFVLLAKIASLSGVWIGQIVGSFGAHFSLASCLPSVVGMYGGIAGLLLTGLFGGGLHMAGSVGLGKLLAYTIPGMCAAFCWSNRSSKVRAILPLICMALFVAHPVGGSVALYSLYWLIPVALSFRNNALWSDALISSFVAHAVGSVIWLYTVPMASAYWLGLIPVVPFERCAVAAGMVLLYLGARQVVSVCHQLRLWLGQRLASH